VTAGKWAEQPADVIGAKILQVLEQNAGVAIDSTCIPKRVRVEFGIPTTAKAIDLARAVLDSIEEGESLQGIEPSAPWRVCQAAG
jgi:hypothetical protein